MTYKLKKSKIKSEILTIMFVDLCEYTNISSKLDKEEFSYLHDTFDTMCLSTFEEFEGNVIKKIGDAFLVTFKSINNALDCGVKLQKYFREYNKEIKPKYKLEIKVSIHSGEVILRNNDVYGDVVNVASRLVSITPPSNIYLTKAVYLSINGSKLSFSSIGLKKFKGVQHQIHVSRVNWDTSRRKFVPRKINIHSKIIEFLLVFLGIVATSIIINIIMN